MKHKFSLVLILAVCIVVITACESSENSRSRLSESEQKEYDLISKYFDIKAYEENDGLIMDNTTDKALSFMMMDHTRFEIGMCYDEILSLGYKPVEESFAEKKPKSLAVTGEFVNDKESSVTLAFASKDPYDDNSTVRDGGYLYEISGSPEDNIFSIDVISENSTILDIINAFGDPYKIDSGSYSDFPDIMMTYKSKELSQYLTFYVNLETERIVSVHLEGYPQQD